MKKQTLIQRKIERKKVKNDWNATKNQKQCTAKQKQKYRVKSFERSKYLYEAFT